MKPGKMNLDCPVSIIEVNVVFSFVTPMLIGGSLMKHSKMKLDLPLPSSCSNKPPNREGSQQGLES
jgi:hypothetical protein